MFNDELDLLEIRLHHHRFVDQFIIIESTRTYSGKEKPLHFQLNRGRFQEFSDRIYHIALDFPFRGNGSWEYEHLQRNLLRGFTFMPGDILLYADCDELVRDETVIETFRRSGKDIMSLQMELGFYFLNVRVKTANVPGATYHLSPVFKSKWHMAKLLKADLLLAFNPLYRIREYQLHNPTDLITNAGWHFSNLGSAARIYQKLQAISHCHDSEFAGLSESNIAHRRESLVDPLGRDGVTYEIHNDMPDYAVKNRERFHDYFHS